MKRLSYIAPRLGYFVAIYLLLCIHQITSAQDLQVFRSFDKYGYKDASGNIVISPQFTNAHKFSEGLAAVETNGKWGYINQKGSFVIQPQFEGQGSFTNSGLAGVKLNGKWGYIDKTGKFVIQPQFEREGNFASNGLARVKLNGKWGYIDEAGKFVIQPQFEEIYAFDSNGLTCVKLNGKWGYIDEAGKILIQPQFEETYAFDSNGLAIVKLNGKWGYIDKAGKFVIQPQFEEIHVFASNGLASVKLNGKWGYIDEAGKFVIQPQFEETYAFEPNGPAKVKLDGKWGYIDYLGIFYSNKDWALAAIEEKIYKVEVNESYTAYINRIVPTWEKYMQENGIKKPTVLSAEIVKQMVEQVVDLWQQKGEFETTTAWQARVNDETRAAKVKDFTKQIEEQYNDKIANYNTRISQLKNDYEAEYKKASDWYCKAKAKEFAKQSFELEPYDADNETFLISSATEGDILLPVPLAKAQQFKSDWANIKSSVTAVFVPTGNDVALKSVTFGDYTYDGNTKANYAVTNIDYNFNPIEITNLDLASAEYNFDPIGSAPTIATISNPEAKTISATKVTPKSRTITAGSASDVDLNIPQSKATAKNTFAIVIANENYQNVEHVENAANDGKVVAKYFTSTLGIPQDQVMTYTDASYGNIIDAFDRIKNISQAYKDGDYNVIFYYAGHGIPDEQSHEAYLLPVDGKPGSTAVNIPLSKLYATLGDLGASTVYVMLDACFSGSQRGDGMLAQARSVAIKAKAAEPQGNMVILSAAQGNETAYPYQGKSHGMFTYFLLKKLQESSGNVTIGELADYVIDNVKKTSVIKNNGKIQTPTVRASLSSGELWRHNKLVK
jgi:hypothetical protein